jgi:hypothetical protein
VPSADRRSCPLRAAAAHRAIKSKAAPSAFRLAPADGGKEALAFDYGFKVRPFFPRLIEPVAERHKWMDEQHIDHQIVGTWPDIFGYGLPRDACIAWHRMLNDTLAEWTCGQLEKILLDLVGAAHRRRGRRRRSSSAPPALAQSAPSSPPTSRT